MGSTILQRGRVRAGVADHSRCSSSWRSPRPATAGDGHGHGPQSNDYQLTVMGTTDLHGNALNWDYFKNAEYDDSAHNDVGLAKVSTLVNQVRADRGRPEHAAHRRRRHHPGHPAGVLLRQDRADLEARRCTRWPRR